jgi:hypothetical protein
LKISDRLSSSQLFSKKKMKCEWKLFNRGTRNKSVCRDGIFSICCLFIWHLLVPLAVKSKGQVIDFSSTVVQTFARCSKNLTINHILHAVRNKLSLISTFCCVGIVFSFYFKVIEYKIQLSVMSRQ